ncbi:VWA domain-containing protein [Halobaculum lipolyticum]|uniref:VWA domain-containing protein n=1 Tax=Halobaculum lipolyticum TaxID=3032001 RepID=A0ABD5W923_9EURY|nr:VWA domain-containing protein [Halobaculum sp. DT31]
MDDTPKLFNTSRRQVLAGLGAVGLASAGAGLGTTAYFSDTESFSGNSLQAGEFDLKVDWKQLYFGAEGDSVYGDAGRPYVNAFPDADGDGVQDEILTRPEIAAGDQGLTSQEVEDAYRAQFADLPNDREDPVIDLVDVKPGDHGCLSMSMHLFDNPGYIWLGADNVVGSENGQSEPEAEVDDSAEGMGELAESINATLWYDDDNDCEIDGGSDNPADVAIVIDTSGSMAEEPNKFENAKDGAKTLVDALGPGTQITLVEFDSDASKVVALTTDKTAVKTAIDGLTANGATDMADGVQIAREELMGRDDLISGHTPSGNDDDSADKIMVFLTNGNPNPSGQDPTSEADDAKTEDGIEVFTIAYGSDANATILEDMASTPKNDHFFLAVDITAVEQVFALIGEQIAGEAVIFSGTLAEVLAELESGVELDGNRVEEGRQCFVNSTTQYVGLHWHLPVEVGNEIQTDTLSFDLVLEAEQCRHNEEPANPFNASA